MLGGFLSDNQLIEKQPDSYDSLFDGTLFEEVYDEMK